MNSQKFVVDVAGIALTVEVEVEDIAAIIATATIIVTTINTIIAIDTIIVTIATIAMDHVLTAYIISKTTIITIVN